MSKKYIKMDKIVKTIVQHSDNDKKEFSDALNWCVQELKINNYYDSDVNSETISWESKTLGEEIYLSIIEILRKKPLFDGDWVLDTPDNTNCEIINIDDNNYDATLNSHQRITNKNTDVVIGVDRKSDNNKHCKLIRVNDNNNKNNDDDNNKIKQNNIIKINQKKIVSIESIETDFMKNKKSQINNNRVPIVVVEKINNDIIKSSINNDSKKKIISTVTLDNDEIIKSPGDTINADDDVEEFDPVGGDDDLSIDQDSTHEDDNDKLDVQVIENNDDDKKLFIIPCNNKLKKDNIIKFIEQIHVDDLETDFSHNRTCEIVSQAPRPESPMSTCSISEFEPIDDDDDDDDDNDDDDEDDEEEDDCSDESSSDKSYKNDNNKNLSNMDIVENEIFENKKTNKQDNNINKLSNNILINQNIILDKNKSLSNNNTKINLTENKIKNNHNTIKNNTNNNHSTLMINDRPKSIPNLISDEILPNKIKVIRLPPDSKSENNKNEIIHNINSNKKINESENKINNGLQQLMNKLLMAKNSAIDKKIHINTDNVEKYEAEILKHCAQNNTHSIVEKKLLTNDIVNDKFKTVILNDESNKINNNIPLLSSSSSSEEKIEEFESIIVNTVDLINEDEPMLIDDNQIDSIETVCLDNDDIIENKNSTSLTADIIDNEEFETEYLTNDDVNSVKNSCVINELNDVENDNLNKIDTDNNLQSSNIINEKKQDKINVLDEQIQNLEDEITVCHNTTIDNNLQAEKNKQKILNGKSSSQVDNEDIEEFDPDLGSDVDNIENKIIETESVLETKKDEIIVSTNNQLLENVDEEKTVIFDNKIPDDCLNVINQNIAFDSIEKIVEVETQISNDNDIIVSKNKSLIEQVEEEQIIEPVQQQQHQLTNNIETQIIDQHQEEPAQQQQQLINNIETQIIDQQQMIVGQDLPMICAKEEVVSFRNNCITKNDDYDKPINQVIHNNTELIITKNDIHQFETFGDRITIGSDIIIEQDISSNNTSVLLKPHAGKNWNIDNDVPLDCTKKDKANCDDEQIPITNVIPSIIYQQDKIISLNSTQQPIQQSVIDSVFDSDHAYPTQEATMIHGNESLDLQIGSQHVIQALQNGIGEQYCSNLTDENPQINQEEEQPVFADKVFNDQRYFIQPIFDPISGSNLVLNQCPVPTTQISLDGNEEHGLAWNQRGKKRKSMEDIDEDEDEGEDEDEVGVAEQSVSMNSPHSSRSMFTNDNQYTPYEEEKEEDDNEYHPPARRRRLNQDPDIDNDEEEYEDNNDNGNKRISRDGKKPRQMIPYEYKLKVLELKRKYPDISLQRLKELSGCSKFLRCNSQLRSWAKQLSHIKKECHIRGEINDYVYSRFINTQNSCGKITDDSVKAWCDEALKKIPCKTIKANDEWLESFKIDYKISKFLSGQLVIYPDTSNRENNTNNYLQLNHSNEYDGNEDDNDDNDENDDDADDADDDAMDTEHEKIHVNSIDNQNVIIAEENHNVDMEIDDNNEKIIENDNDINIGDKTNDNYNINNHIEDNENITTSAVELYNPINNKKTKKSYKKIKNNKKVEMSRSKRVVLTDEEKIVIIKIHYKNPTWTLSQLREATFSRLKGASQIKHWEHVLRTKGAFNDDMINTNNNNDTITLQKLIEVNGRQRRDKMVKTGIKKRNDNNNKQIKINNKKKQLKIRKFSKKKTNDKQVKLNKKQRGESHLRIANKKRNFRKDIILRTTRNGDKYKLTADDNKQNLNNNTNININNNNNNINNNNSNKVKKNSKKTVRFDINKDDNTDENIKNLVDNWVYAKCIELKNENRKLRNNILTKWAIIANDKFNEGGDYGGDKPWREAFKKKYNLTGAYDNLQLGNENLLQVTDETNENDENNDNDIDDNGNINDNVDDYDNNEDDDNEHEANNDDEDDDEAEDQEEEEDDDVNDNDDDGDDDDNDDDNNEDEDEEEEEDDTIRNDDEDNFNHDHNISPTMKSDDQDDYTPESLKNILNLNDSKVKIVSVEKMVGPTISGAIYNPANGQIKWRLDTP